MAKQVFTGGALNVTSLLTGLTGTALTKALAKISAFEAKVEANKGASIKIGADTFQFKKAAAAPAVTFTNNGTAFTTAAALTTAATAPPTPAPTPAPTAAPTPAPTPAPQALTTGTTDVLVGTSGNDTFTGVDSATAAADTYQDTDLIVDGSTTDADVYNLTLVDAATPNARNVESVNITLNNLATKTITASSLSGVTNLTITRGDVTLGGSTITGAKDVTVTALDASKVSKVTAGAGTTTVSVTQATKAGVTLNADTATGAVTLVGAGTVSAAASTGAILIDDTAAPELTKAISVTADKASGVTTGATFTGAITVKAAAGNVTINGATGGATVTTAKAGGTVVINNIDDTGATITAGSGTTAAAVTINLDGTAATTDVATVSASGEVNLDANTTDLVETLTLSGNGAAVRYSMVSSNPTKYTLSGSQNVTVVMAVQDAAADTITDSTTAGTTTLELTGAVGAAHDLSAAAVDRILVTSALGTAGGANEIVVATGANLVFQNDQVALGIDGKAADAVVNISTADDTAASGADILIEVGAFDAATNVKTVNLTASVGKFTATSTTLADTATLNISGSKAVTLGAVTAATVAAAAATGAISLSDAAGDKLTSVTTGSGADSITFDSAVAVTVDGGAGNDSLTLTAYGASSLFTAGDGDDTIGVATATGLAVIDAGGGNDTVTVGGDSEALFLGGAGAADKLSFSTGTINFSDNSTFSFGGFETVDLGAAGTVSIKNSQFNAQTFTLTGAAGRTLAIVGTSSADTINASTITVTSGAVSISGAGGNDTITGTSKDDTIAGGAGSDVIAGGSGNDTATYTGGANTDDDGTQTGIVVNLGSSSISAATLVGQLGTSAGRLAASLTEVAASRAAYLYGDTTSTNSAAVDSLDSIENIVGTDGIDYLVGSAGVNAIDGGTGADYIDGGIGNDTITGGVGADVLKGGVGADSFVFAAGDTGTPSGTNFDEITDYLLGSDIVDYGATALVRVTAGTAGAGQAAITNGVAAFDASDTSLAARVAAVNAGLVAGTEANGQFAVFTVGADTYLYILDDTADTVDAADVLIKLTGVAGTAATVTDGNLVIS